MGLSKKKTPKINLLPKVPYEAGAIPVEGQGEEKVKRISKKEKAAAAIETPAATVPVATTTQEQEEPIYMDFSTEAGKEAKEYLNSDRPEGYISFVGLIIAISQMVDEGLVETKIAFVTRIVRGKKIFGNCKVVSMTTDILKEAINRVLGHREGCGFERRATRSTTVTATDANNTLLAAEKFLANAKEYNPGVDLSEAESILGEAKDTMKSLVLDPAIADFAGVKEAAEQMFPVVHDIVNSAREASVRRQLAKLPSDRQGAWEAELEKALAEVDPNDRRKAIGTIGTRLVAAGYRDPEWKPLPKKALQSDRPQRRELRETLGSRQGNRFERGSRRG